MADLGWARSRGERAEKEGLRRGAWYRVVEDDAAKAWVVLDVHHVEVRVPKDDIDVKRDAPNTWSVVHDPHLVCPGCHQRRHLSGHKPKDVKCAECGNTYGVDWSDKA